MLIHRPSLCGGVGGLVAPSTGIGAEALLRGVIFDIVVVAGGVSGGNNSSEAALISPVHPTKVWFQGILFEDKYEKESNNAEVPRRGESSYTQLGKFTLTTINLPSRDLFDIVMSMVRRKSLI